MVGAMRRTRNTKIVATLGPSSSEPPDIARLFEAGADVFRLNLSHGTHAEHKARFDAIRALEKDFGRPVGVLFDLQGPKLRVGDFAGGSALLEAGGTFRLDLDEKPGDSRRAPLPHPEIFAALKPGTSVLLDDGRVHLRVVRCWPNLAETEVVTGGQLSDHKGVNVPSVVLDLSPLTEKDRKDLRFGLDLGVEWIALSFVQKPDDIAEARKLIAGRTAVMVKLEKPSAIEHLDEIVEQADAVMVARGDLGVELPPEEVPGLQKKDRARLPPHRQAGGGGYPDAGIHGPCTDPHPRRGQRRGHRRQRGGRRDHAVGGIGGWRPSGGSGFHDGPYR